MSTGYQVDVNRRYGGHGGHATAWEFSTRTWPPDRVRALEALAHPLIVNFLYRDGGASFDVLQADDGPEVKALAMLLVEYLTAWPECERELLRRIAP